MSPDVSAAARVLLGEDRDHLIHPQHHPVEQAGAIVWASGQGVRLTDVDGRTYLDALSGMWNVALGHGRRELVAAGADQLARLAFATSYAGSATVPTIELAARLRDVVYPSITAFYFTTSGSEATDATIRTARYYWRALGRPEKSTIVALERSYHGSSVGAASATGVPEFTEPFGPRQPGFAHAPSPDPYRLAVAPGTDPAATAAGLVEQTILRIGPERVAALLVEPVQGGGAGVVVPPPGYLARLRALCDAYDVLLVADDVITGFGRTGRWFGLEHDGVEPDVVQLAKGITSGYVPLGAIGVSAAVKDVLDTAPPDRRWWHGGTYSGHPVAAAVALATIGVIEREGLVEAARLRGERLVARLREALDGHPHLGEVRGRGLLAGVELVADPATRSAFPPDDDVGRRLRAGLLERGVVTRVLGTVVCLAPPLVVTDSDIDEIVDAVTDTVRAVLGR